MFKKATLYLLGIVLLLITPDFTTLAYGQTTVFGPEFYTRSTGKPQKIIKSFSVQNLNQEFTLSVQNGEGKRERVSSAVIEINGVKVVGPEEFNKQVSMITKPINLKQQNEIAVEVRSKPGTSIVVTILGSLPSVTGIIYPQGGTITLEGYATVIFPAGAFTVSQNITVSATAFPETQEDFSITADIDELGPRLPYEIRINSGYTAPTTSIDAIFNVPGSFITTLPSNAKIEVFVQILHVGEYEALDNFYYGFSSVFDSLAKTVRITLPPSAFTKLRRSDKTYEAIVIVGTIFK